MCASTPSPGRSPTSSPWSRCEHRSDEYCPGAPRQRDSNRGAGGSLRPARGGRARHGARGGPDVGDPHPQQRDPHAAGGGPTDPRGAGPTCPGPPRPEPGPRVVPHGGLLRGAAALLRRLRRRRHRRPARAHLPPGLPGVAGRGLRVDPALLPLARARRRLRHLRLHGHRPALRDDGGLPRAGPPGPPARDPHHHRHGHQPHLGRPPLVPGLPLGPRGPLRGLLRVGRRRLRLRRRPHHLRGHRGVQLGLRRRARPVLLAPLLLPPARPQLPQPGGHRGDPRRHPLLGAHRGGRLPPRRHPLPDRVGGHQLREPGRHPRDHRRDPSDARPGVPRDHHAGRGQPVARGRRGVLRHRGGARVHHVLPLPGHAAHLLRTAAGLGLGHPLGAGEDPRHPRPRAVGDLPAQPR